MDAKKSAFHPNMMPHAFGQDRHLPFIIRGIVAQPDVAVKHSGRRHPEERAPSQIQNSATASVKEVFCARKFQLYRREIALVEFCNELTDARHAVHNVLAAGGIAQADVIVVAEGQGGHDCHALFVQ